MSIRHLKIFIMVADTGKMSLAAEKMFLSQPTISQAIKELEDYYGVLLFERLSKKIYITSEGKRLLSQARQVVALFDEMNELMRGTDCRIKLRVGATVTIGSSIMLPALKEYKRCFPEVEVEVVIHNTKKMEELLLKSQLDFAFIEGIVKSKDLMIEKVVEDRLVLVCGRNHPFFHRESVLLEELKNEVFILREEGSGTRELFETYMNENHIAIKIGWSCITPEIIKKAVIDGMGITVVSNRLVNEEVKQQNLHIIKLPEDRWNRSFTMVHHKNKYITREMEEFVNIVKNMYRIDGENNGKKN